MSKITVLDPIDRISQYFNSDVEYSANEEFEISPNDIGFEYDSKDE